MYRSRGLGCRKLNKQDDFPYEAGYQFKGAIVLPFQQYEQRHTQNHDAIELDSV